MILKIKVTSGQKVKFVKLILQQSYVCCWKCLDVYMKSMELVKQNTLIFTPFSPLKIWKHKENEKLKEEKWIVEVPHMDHNVVHVVQVWNVPQNANRREWWISEWIRIKNMI